jgi:hypothetical protein
MNSKSFRLFKVAPASIVARSFGMIVSNLDKARLWSSAAASHNMIVFVGLGHSSWK